ncbi:hypothetical protein ASF78_08715 [Cellulomonas sp. Leaf334]|nr:hypothetical protein ASF78_08715 [Cellulomonas sp. Leaf334]
MAVLALLSTGCAPDRRDMERQAATEARSNAQAVQAWLGSVVQDEAGSTPEEVVDALEQSLEGSTIAMWNGPGVTTGRTTTWPVAVVGSASESSFPSNVMAYARLCFDATFDHGSGAVTLSDIDCPADAGTPDDAIDADLEP